VLQAPLRFACHRVRCAARVRALSVRSMLLAPLRLPRSCARRAARVRALNSASLSGGFSVRTDAERGVRVPLPFCGDVCENQKPLRTTRRHEGGVVIPTRFKKNQVPLSQDKVRQVAFGGRLHHVFERPCDSDGFVPAPPTCPGRSALPFSRTSCP
jgi:hypothetical protein